MSRCAIALLAVLVAMLVPAIAAEMKMDHPADNEVASAFTTANDKMMRSMASPLSGDADMDFVMMMIPHHEGAIDMAKIELQYGKDPMLREMAEQIIKAQEEEIAKMRKWQQEHGR